MPALSGRASPERDEHPHGQHLVAGRHVRFPLATVGNHGWETGGEARLIHVALLVAQLGTGLPAHSRCCPGNAIGEPGPIRAVPGLGGDLGRRGGGHHGRRASRPGRHRRVIWEKASFVGGLEGKPGIMPWLDGGCLGHAGKKGNLAGHGQRHADMERAPCGGYQAD
jgi:hypothetical protein